jgi:hypothetical protein
MLASFYAGAVRFAAWISVQAVFLLVDDIFDQAPQREPSLVLTLSVFAAVPID